MKPDLTPLEPWIARKIGSVSGRVDRAELERYQLQRLRATLRMAREKSVFYRKHLADAPRDLTGLDDLARLPFTTPQDIRANPLQFLCVSQDEIQRVVTLDSSGTTGEPKRIYFTRDDQELTLDFFHIGMSTFTAASDRVLILLPAARPGSVGDLLATALERLGACGIKHGPFTDVPATLAVMAQQQVDGVVGTPTQVLLLARHSERSGLKLKSVLLTTDHVPHAIVSAVEQAWGCTVYNHYGMTEMGLGGGVECRARRGYHMREADLLFEVVNPTTGLPVPDGEPGELVFTTLTRTGMPLIRYRTGDLSRCLPGACPCGTTLQTLERVRHRLHGFMRVGASGQLTMADLDEALFPLAGLVHFSAALTRATGDHLHIEAFMTTSVASDATSAIDAALDTIPAIQRARQAGELTVSVTIKPQATTAAPLLAKRMIVDRRGAYICAENQ